MATLVSGLINQALIDLRFIPAGATVGTDIQTECFLRLNQLLASLSDEGAMVFNQVVQSFALSAGVVGYTLGASGTMATTGSLRAQKVTAWRALSGDMNEGGPALSLAEFGAAARAMQQELAALTAQTVLEGLTATVPSPLVSPVPMLVGADTSYPSINVRVFPTPSSAPGNLELAYWTPIAAFATVGDSIALPSGYERMLHLTLAVDLHPRYGKLGPVDPILLADAQQAKAAIVAQNTMMSAQPQPAQQQQ